MKPHIVRRKQEPYVKPFKFFQKGRPYWLDLPKDGEPLTSDSIISGVSPLTFDPTDFTLRRRIMYWSDVSNKHFYGPMIKEDNEHFNLQQIDIKDE